MSGGKTAADRRDEVLDAAYTCLTRYGVRRTTMDDIAAEMGVSRSALYQYVSGKDAAFRLLAERLHARALDRARAVAASDAPVGDRVLGVLGVKLDLVLDLRGDSPHAAELLDARARLFGDVCAGFTAEVRALLVAMLSESGPGDAVGSGDAVGDTAEILLAVVTGLEGASEPRRLLARAVDALFACPGCAH
ncbi:TetR/AcrR family transcriptional regulator [Kitasatospora misakiensis]|uniref:TetR/AcrR family transcriptional regulator n=1 Tax=Kitasatospora misakiensis TaxID=67330 RepID=A0ABW0X0G8_9ACTN